jgi:hypothetical protein
MKLAGNKDGELYRLLLVAQCNASVAPCPSCSSASTTNPNCCCPATWSAPIRCRSLVDEIPEEDWNEVEIIGWLYQFYISREEGPGHRQGGEASEDIPAATQLFTPNWIVKYMVQNSLGGAVAGTYPAQAQEQMAVLHRAGRADRRRCKAQLAA